MVRMTLGEHIEELRKRVLRALIGVVVGMVICFFFGEHLFKVMFWPLEIATSGSPPDLYYQSLPESFGTYFRVCLIAGAIFSSPYGLYQMWQFIGAGLYDRERVAVRKYLLPSFVLFILGVVFFLVVVAPLIIGFFLHFAQSTYPSPPNWGGEWLGPFLGRGDLATATTQAAATQPASARPYVQPLLTVGKYVSFVALLSFVFGLAFQTPLVVYFLGRTGIVPVKTMRQGRRYVAVAIMGISAVVTPSDVGSMVALAVPMYLLYEIGLLFAGRAERPAAN